MPAGRDRMDGNERFRQMVNNGNPNVLGVLLAELGEAEAKQLIEECYRQEADTALLHCVKRLHDGKDKKDPDVIECCSLLLKYGAAVDETDATKRTALHWACSQANAELVQVLLEAGANPCLKDASGYNALHIAIGSGDAASVKLILNYHKEVIKLLTDDGVAPPIAAIHKGDADVLKALVLSGADVNVQESVTARTPLHYALYIKRRDLFEFLIENGADICRTDHRGTNIIHRCCAIQEPSFLQCVLNKAGNSSRKKALQMADNEGASPIIVACQNGNVEQLRLLLDAEAPASGKDRFKRCALHHCVENTDTECAEVLLRSVPSMLNTADEEGLTPLHMAVIAGNVPLIELLLAKGANLSAVDNEKHSVAHWATVCGHTAVLDVLLARGAKLSSPDKYQAFPIHYAAQMMSKKGSDADASSEGNDGGSIQILKTLLKNKVSSEVEDKDKRTPIIWAASAGSSEACRVLVEQGANVNRADKDDLTAMHCAASRGHSRCVETLVRHCKAKVDPVDKNQCTPLFYATTLGHVNTLKTLLELKADCSHTDTRGRTIAHCATVSGSVEVLDILKRHQVDLWSRNLKGDQPLHEAAQAGHTDILNYLLVHADGHSDAINRTNHDGRTCLHIAALTNNAWLTHWLMEKKANINAMMKNKGKYYTPYDAALVKGHTEVKDILLSKGGRAGSDISNRAAQTIQVKYRYHRRKGSRKGSFTSQKLKNKRQDSKEKEKEKGKDKDETKGKDTDKKSDKKSEKKINEEIGKEEEKESPVKTQDSESIKAEEADIVEKNEKNIDDVKIVETVVVTSEAVLEKQAVEEDKNKEEAQDGDKSTPVYVDRGTQVSGVSSGSPGRQLTPKKDFHKRKTKRKGDPGPQSKHRTESPSDEQKLTETQIKPPSEEQNLTDTHIQSPSKENTSLVTAEPTVVVTKNENDRDEEQSCDDYDVRSERSSSHGNVSDVESCSSDVNQKSKVRKRSPAVRNRSRTSTSKTSSHHSSDQDSEVKVTKSVKSTSSNAKPPKGAPSVHSASSKSSVSSRQVSDKDSVSLTPRSNASPRDKHRTSSFESPSNTNSKRQSDTSKGGSDSDRGKFSQRSENIGIDRKAPTSDQEMGSLFSSSKRKPSKALKGRDGQMTEEKQDKMNGHAHDSANEDDQGYTDTEEWTGPNTGREEEDTPRKKKTRPSKLISRVQESVRRYEAERKSIRQLHQIRRAQIYSGPVYDVALFRKIVDNVNSKQNKEYSSNAETWEAYLQEQLKIIQEERKVTTVRPATSPCRAPKSGNESPTRPPKGNNAVFPLSNSQPKKGREPAPGDNEVKTEVMPLRLGQSSQERTTSYSTTPTPTSNSTSRNDVNRVNTTRPPRQARAQTAHVTRAYGPNNKRQIGNSRYETLRERHEQQKQKLIEAYRPFGGAELLNDLPRPRPMTSHPRPMSTMSSKTATSTGSHASARQTRTPSYTIMTPYGSRRLREPWEGNHRPDTSFPNSRHARQPLVFQDPDTYDKLRRGENVQAKGES